MLSSACKIAEIYLQGKHLENMYYTLNDIILTIFDFNDRKSINQHRFSIKGNQDHRIYHLSIISIVFPLVRIHFFLVVFFKIDVLLFLALYRNIEVLAVRYGLPHASVWLNKRVCFWFSYSANTFQNFFLFLVYHIHFLKVFQLLDICFINFFRIPHFFLGFLLFILHHPRIISIADALDSHTISINNILLADQRKILLFDLRNFHRDVWMAIFLVSVVIIHNLNLNCNIIYQTYSIQHQYSQKITKLITMASSKISHLMQHFETLNLLAATSPIFNQCAILSILFIPSQSSKPLFQFRIF